MACKNHSSSSIVWSGFLSGGPGSNFEIVSSGTPAGNEPPHPLEKTEAIPPSLSRRGPTLFESIPSFFRTPSSKPGKLARCFLNGDPMIAPGSRSTGSPDGGGWSEPAVNDAIPFDEPVRSSVGISVEVGVVANGLCFRSCSFGEGTLSGSAERWRFSYSRLVFNTIRQNTSMGIP